MKDGSVRIGRHIFLLGISLFLSFFFLIHEGFKEYPFNLDWDAFSFIPFLFVGMIIFVLSELFAKVFTPAQKLEKRVGKRDFFSFDSEKEWCEEMGRRLRRVGERISTLDREKDV